MKTIARSVSSVFAFAGESLIAFAVFAALGITAAVISLLFAAVNVSTPDFQRTYLIIAAISGAVGTLSLLIHLRNVRELRNDPFVKAYRSTSEYRK